MQEVLGFEALLCAADQVSHNCYIEALCTRDWQWTVPFGGLLSAEGVTQGWPITRRWVDKK
jgi:hypothetical protein